MWDSGTLLAISPSAGESFLRPPLLKRRTYSVLLVITLTATKFGTKGATDKYLVMSHIGLHTMVTNWQTHNAGHVKVILDPQGLDAT